MKEGPADRIIWFHSPNEVYSTKSRYSWLILKRVGYGPQSLFWRLIWKLNVSPNLRIFVLRMGHNLLPTNVKIASINKGFNRVLPRCNNVEETLVHALRDCVKSREILMLGGIHGRLLTSE